VFRAEVAFAESAVADDGLRSGGAFVWCVFFVGASWLSGRHDEDLV